MDAAKRKVLQAAGWKIGDAADFLELSDGERQLLDARVEIALAIRRQRKIRRLSQADLGAKLKTSQPRVAKIERAATDVSLDQLVRAFAAAGGKITVKIAKAKPRKGKSAKRPASGQHAPNGSMILEAAISEPSRLAGRFQKAGIGGSHS
jgi:transcriptional regulator with XRE-family HTH domain